MTRNADFDVSARDVPDQTFPRRRIRFSLGARGREAARRRSRMHDLRRWGAYDVLAGITQGELDVAIAAAEVAERGEAAVHVLRDWIHAARAGGVPTFRSESELYLKWYRENRQLSSYLGVKRFLEAAAELFGEKPLNKVSSSDVEALRGRYEAAGTKELARSAVSGMYTWSIRRERERARHAESRARYTAEDNPARYVEVTKGQVLTTTATDGQISALLGSAVPYQEAYLRALYQLGLRAAELRHTRLSLDLDVDDWIWRIQARGPDPTCSCNGCRSRGWSPKTKRSHRTLHVPADLVELRRSIEVLLELYPCEPGDRVFRHPRLGRPWVAPTFRRDFERLCDRAGVRYGRDGTGGITPHTLRHTFATRMLRAGCSETILARIMGDTVQTISRVYVHPTAHDLSIGLARLREPSGS